jgi:hypothetical protein
MHGIRAGERAPDHRLSGLAATQVLAAIIAALWSSLLHVSYHVTYQYFMACSPGLSAVGHEGLGPGVPIASGGMVFPPEAKRREACLPERHTSPGWGGQL